MADILTFAYKGTGPGKASYLHDKLLNNPPRLMSVDIETRSLKDRTIIGIGFGLSPTESIYVPRHSPEFTATMALLSNRSITKLFHNALGFDLLALTALDHNVDTTNILDTMLMCNMEGLPQELATISQALGREIKRIRDILPARATMDQLQDDVVADKCADDCMATMLVYEKLWPEIDHNYFKREMSLIPTLMAMSRRGIKIDQQRRQTIEDKLSAEVEFYRMIADGEGFNPASTKQVAKTLMRRGCRLPIHRKNGKYSAPTDEEVLKRISDPLAALVLLFRKYSKLLSTYIIPYRGQDRAYTRFHMNTATGRLASTERNMQNIPAGSGTNDMPGIRTMFLPDSGTLTDADFSQQELRILAHISQDPTMLEIYNRGLDIHQETADFMGIGRRIAKNVTFAMVYGASDETIMETAGITNKQKAHELGIAWRSKYPKAAKWIEEIQEQGLADRYVRTIQGRKLWLPSEIEEEEGGRRRKATNFPIQGSAAEMTKDAMIRCVERGYRLVLQVHDELVIDGNIDEEELRGSGIEDLGPVHCPISIKHLDRWE